MSSIPISEQVRSAILECGVSRYALAQRTGISEAVLSKFVNGHVGITLTTLERLAPAIGLRVVVKLPKGRA